MEDNERLAEVATWKRVQDGWGRRERESRAAQLDALSRAREESRGWEDEKDV
jgi:hypothetical protein